MENLIFFFLIIVFRLLFGYVAINMAKNRNRDTAIFFIVGFVFGIFGLLFLLFVPCKEEKTQHHKNYQQLK
jgi:hypothetical protein